MAQGKHMEDELFAKLKVEQLKDVDLSRKGSIDSAIIDLVNYINGCPAYFTTSSCSGRIVLFSTKADKEKIQKQGCKWLHVTHDACRPEDLIAHLNDPGDIVFKFEAFVIHIQCRSLEDAQLVLSAAVQSGFRNSGISYRWQKRKKGVGKIVIAVRSTHSLEVPLSCRGELLVNEKYVEFLVQKANILFNENQNRIQRFFDNVKSNIERASVEQT